MKHIAAHAGVSVATVSYALGSNPRIPPATRDRIRRLARRLGYRPDPVLSALVAYRARTRPVADYGVIAILHDMEKTERPPHSFRIQVEAATERAHALGYRTELFHIGSGEADSFRLSRTLYARGIRGILCLTLRRPSLRLEWEHFSSVVIGEYFSEPRLIHIGSHHAHVLSTTYRGLRSLGYRRIGFCNGRINEERKHHLYLSEYLKCLFLDGISVADSPPLLHEPGTWSPIPWLDRHRFDAVMTMVPDALIARLDRSRYKVPASLGVAGFILSSSPDLAHLSGCTVNHKAIARRAIDTLQSMILRGQRGIPSSDDYYDVLVRGQWHSGRTTRRLRPGKSSHPAPAS